MLNFSFPPMLSSLLAGNPQSLTTGPLLFLLSSHSCFQAGIQVAFSFSLIIRSSGRSSILCNPLRVSLFSISRLKWKENEIYIWKKISKNNTVLFHTFNGHVTKKITVKTPKWFKQDMKIPLWITLYCWNYNMDSVECCLITWVQ